MRYLISSAGPSSQLICYGDLEWEGAEGGHHVDNYFSQRPMENSFMRLAESRPLLASPHKGSQDKTQNATVPMRARTLITSNEALLSFRQ